MTSYDWILNQSPWNSKRFTWENYQNISKLCLFHWNLCDSLLQTIFWGRAILFPHYTWHMFFVSHRSSGYNLCKSGSMFGWNGKHAWCRDKNCKRPRAWMFVPNPFISCANPTIFSSIFKFALWIHWFKWRVSWADLLWCGWTMVNIDIVGSTQSNWDFLPGHRKGLPTKRIRGKKVVTGKWTAVQQRNQCLQDQAEKKHRDDKIFFGMASRISNCKWGVFTLISVHHFSDQIDWIALIAVIMLQIFGSTHAPGLLVSCHWDQVHASPSLADQKGTFL